MEDDDQPLLDCDRIVELLHQLADEAERRGISAALFLVGGGAMALGYTTGRTTRDLDGVFGPKRSTRWSRPIPPVPSRRRCTTWWRGSPRPQGPRSEDD